mgnify:CR=1 FL=1
MGKNQRKTYSQKYRLKEGSYKRSLRHQLNTDGTPLFQNGHIDASDVNASRKIPKTNRTGS